MKLKQEFEIVSMADEVLAVPLDEGENSLSGVLRLNSIGREIFEMLKTEITEKEIVAKLCTRYEDDRETIEGYVHSFLQVLIDNNIL